MAIIKPSKPNTFINGAGNTADANEVNENFDILYAKEGEIIDAVNNAAGTKASITSRLTVSMNDDGTMKTPITSGGEWINPGLAATFISATQFSVVGDHTDIYLADRRVKITIAAGVVYSAVVSSAHSSGVTTVTVGAVLTDPITSVEHSTVRPIASNGAVSAQMVGAAEKAGDAAQRFKVAAAVDGDEALAKDQGDARYIKLVSSTVKSFTTGTFVSSTELTVTSSGINVLAGDTLLVKAAVVGTKGDVAGINTLRVAQVAGTAVLASLIFDSANILRSNQYQPAGGDVCMSDMTMVRVSGSGTLTLRLFATSLGSHTNPGTITMLTYKVGQ